MMGYKSYDDWLNETLSEINPTPTIRPEIFLLLKAAWFAGMKHGQEAIHDDIIDALQSDLENGVRWLNEAASQEFARHYPELLKVINGLGDN